MANIYTFQRRAIYWEEETVEADTVEEAWEKVENGDADELHIGDFHDYWDEEYELVHEKINDPLVNMIMEYENKKQLELDLDFG